MPSESSRRFSYERVLAAVNAVLLFLALLFIVIEFPTRIGFGKVAPGASRQPAITLSNTLSAIPVRKMPDGTEIYDVTCSVATGNQTHPDCITYTRPSMSATSMRR